MSAEAVAKVTCRPVAALAVEAAAHHRCTGHQSQTARQAEEARAHTALLGLCGGNNRTLFADWNRAYLNRLLIPEDGGTRLRLRHEGEASAAIAGQIGGSWPLFLERLDDLRPQPLPAG